MPLTLQQITSAVMDQAKAKGFGTKPDEINVGEKIALIHAEVSEAYEAYRHKKMDGPDSFKEELGDIVQRILHLAGIFDINMEAAIVEKLKRNSDREWQWQDMNENHV